MSQAKAFKIGQAPWETQSSDGPAPFKVGQAPWEVDARMSPGEALAIGAQQGATVGFRPAVAGLGAAAGSLYGNAVTQAKGEGLLDKVGRMGEEMNQAFHSGRSGARAEEAKAMQDRPGWNIAGNLVGTGLTLPFTPVTTARGATGLGALMGAGNAASNSDNLQDAATKVVGGGALGLATQGVVNAAPIVTGMVKKGAQRVSSALTNVNEREIQAYAQRGDQIKKMVHESGGQITEAADQAREQITKQISSKRQSLNAEIAKGLKSAGQDAKLVNAKAVLENIEKKIEQFHPISAQARPGEINELKNIRDLLKNNLDTNGDIFLTDLHVVKEELQKLARPAYKHGQFFVPGDYAAKTAKEAAAEARRIFNNAAPDMAKANNQLSLLHKIERDINKNLITPGKSESALVAAGSGNMRNAKNLGRIDAITGGNAVQTAENLAAMRTFNSPQLLPMDQTGKAIARMAVGGGAVGLATGDYQLGMMGAAATSPMSLKLALDTARMTSRLANATGVAQAGRYLSTPGPAIQSYAAINRMRDGATAAPAPPPTEVPVLQSKENDSAIKRRLENLKGGGKTRQAPSAPAQ